MVGDGAISNKIDYIIFFFEDPYSQRVSKFHYWFKSYSDFDQLVDFVYWWSCIGKGLRLQSVQYACFYTVILQSIW